MRRRSPRPVRVAVEHLAAELAPLTLLAAVQRVWADAVGDAVAMEAQPIAERAGVLTVGCSSSVWAQELDLLAPSVIEALNGRLAHAPIGGLRCRVQ